MVKPNKGSPKKSEDRARTKQETERLKFERQKLHEEHLRAELSNVHFTHREVISLFFKVFLYASLASGALGSLYITIRLSNETGESHLFAFVVAVIGLVTSVFFGISQRLAYVGFQTSRKLYLYPIMDTIGITFEQEFKIRRKRKRLEQKICAVLAFAHIAYTFLWVLFLVATIYKPATVLWI